MKRLVVLDSSMVHAAGYDGPTRTMEVVFTDGRIYFYQDVPRSVYAGLLAAPSKGRFMLDQVIDTYSSIPLSAAARPAKRSARAKPKPTGNAKGNAKPKSKATKKR